MSALHITKHQFTCSETDKSSINQFISTSSHCTGTGYRINIEKADNIELQCKGAIAERN